MSRIMDTATSPTTEPRYGCTGAPVVCTMLMPVSQLTEQHGEYLDALNSWADDYLNIQFSAQIGYNMAVDMVSPITGIPLLCRD